MSDNQAAAAPEHNYEYGREHDGYSHMGIPPACPACAAEPAPDPTPSAALAGIRERHAIATDPRFGSAWLGTRRDTTIKLAYEDIPLLAAALEAVLALTEPSGEVHRDLDGNEEHGVVRVVRCDVLREAITSALSGEERGDGQ